MTKRVLLSLLLLALALCLSVTSYVLLQNRVAKLGQALENAVYTDLPMDESCAQVEACTAHTLPYLRIFIPHTALDALTEHLNTLPLTRKEPERYRRACLQCLILLRELKDSQAVTIENIL